MGDDTNQKLNDLLNTLFRDKKTYLLEKVIGQLEQFKDKVSFETMTHPLGTSMYPDGCRVTVKNTDWLLSVQTASCAVGDAMCESALFWKRKIVYVPELDYGDVIRHYSSSNFGRHLTTFLEAIEGKTIDDFETV